MSIENGVFNLSHSSGVLCVKQVATCVKLDTLWDRTVGIHVGPSKINPDVSETNLQ